MMIHDPSVAAQGRDLVVNLRRTDSDSGGHPSMPPEQMGLARDYLEWLLLEPLLGPSVLVLIGTRPRMEHG